MSDIAFRNHTRELFTKAKYENGAETPNWCATHTHMHTNQDFWSDDVKKGDDDDAHTPRGKKLNTIQKWFIILIRILIKVMTYVDN